MSTEYSISMSEDSSEQSPHKFSRVSDVKTARQNRDSRIQKDDDERIIRLHQEAIERAKTAISTEDVKAPEEVVDVDFENVQMELFRAFVEIAKNAELGSKPFRNIEAAKLINDRFGSALPDSTPISYVVIPSNKQLREVKENPQYDADVVRELLEVNTLIKGSYNQGLSVLAHRFENQEGYHKSPFYKEGQFSFLGTIGELRSISSKELASERSVGMFKANFLLTAFRAK